jgi:hypothetical protein
LKSFNLYPVADYFLAKLDDFALKIVSDDAISIGCEAEQGALHIGQR